MLNRRFEGKSFSSNLNPMKRFRTAEEEEL